mmetsp:Transcript_65450/g.150038  ORF Transcript_65450/g.150038 Transcript_65450/m.150038 type:complete len:391 (+) Transcript_65450:79-1251(+)|eukprot:CAMPEP_0204340658 /NCGR_PEP_ID=MMETSP0469-20131031/22749_1 /ASSEMBLY_ACC=CAM_ASM_000384 /TAXON_ID=2969 /ORGANISM="Oxyrrhis marina" /LENGTH=390 /DNA_ID=CAMNT_0051325225 /DNA_START=63 /DNA_END=1235 /DNA_ORIENTATION=-
MTSALQESPSKLRRDLGSLQAAYDALLRERTDFSARLADADQQRASAVAEIGRLRRERQELSREVRALKQELHDQEAEVKHCRQAVDEATRREQKATTTCKSVREATEVQLEELMRQVESVRSQRAAEVSDWKSRCESKARVVLAKEEEIHQLQEVIRQLKDMSPAPTERWPRVPDAGVLHRLQETEAEAADLQILLQDTKTSLRSKAAENETLSRQLQEKARQVRQLEHDAERVMLTDGDVATLKGSNARLLAEAQSAQATCARLRSEMASMERQRPCSSECHILIRRLEEQLDCEHRRRNQERNEADQEIAELQWQLGELQERSAEFSREAWELKDTVERSFGEMTTRPPSAVGAGQYSPGLSGQASYAGSMEHAWPRRRADPGDDTR